MAGSSLIVGSVKAILEKNSDTIAKKIIKIGKDEWEKFKIDFDISFKKYLENATEKYGMEKTVLNRTKPRYICDFFVYPNLQIGKDVFVGDSINKILSISNFVIIQGGGGTGKSTFLRYLFLDEVSKKDLVPIFIELKTLNSIDGDYDIVDFVFKRLYSLGSTLEKEYMEYALRSGCFLFLFDGYDEIFIEKRERFFQKLEDLCDRFPQNSYILSSRPYSDFIEFQRFALIELQSFTKEQAIEFIQKAEFDLCIKEQFIQELNAYLYEKYRSFASNPLLLSIMLLTFGRYGNIPNKSYLFYANAFETMYSKHDATKSGYHREMRCGLSLEEFKMALAYFCFLSYYQGKVEFTYDEINAIVKKFKAQFPDLKIEDFLYDLVNAVCILIKDGLTYMFIHRSFQEYFTAYFLKEQSDKNMKMLGIKLIKNDCGRAISDDVIALLHDMANERFEENILLPIINEIEQKCDSESKYDFYFRTLSPSIVFLNVENDDYAMDLVTYPSLIPDNLAHEMTVFLFEMVQRYYLDFNTQFELSINGSSKHVYKYLVKNMSYHGEEFHCMNYLYDKELYRLIRKTWIGFSLEELSKLKSLLEKRCKDIEMDLDLLVGI